MARTKIEWTDVTWNPTRGCSRVSEGCRNCYAERTAARFAYGWDPSSGEVNRPNAPYAGLVRSTPKGPRWTGEVRLVPEKLSEPLRWRKPRRVFVDSMSDLFHEKIPDEYIAAVFGVMAACPQHTFQTLTKNPKRMLEWFGQLSGRWMAEPGQEAAVCCGSADVIRPEMIPDNKERVPWPLPNVMLGVSCEDQATADERIPLLLQTPAAVRFVSAEPLLEAVDLKPGWLRWPGTMLDHALDWVIVGGESGPGARPCDVEWIRSIVEQCVEAGTACFVKQIGANAIHGRFCEPFYQDVPSRMRGHICKTEDEPLELRDRKGGDINEWPEDLRVRQFPGEVE